MRREQIESCLAFRPRWTCATYERASRRTDEFRWERLFARGRCAWRCALAWLRLMPWLSVREAELGCGAHSEVLHQAQRRNVWVTRAVNLTVLNFSR